ncbi:MAG: Beta-hydroxyacyl-(acyl-carrier-protein) dehydratase, FabA/FabZ [Bacteroidota bacterium]|nr:Beta-hydroxyacyl-(acyl-carrier-protein) dehydratase, FabA/FabZ [Bacteroidota bacterium]
MLLGDFYTINSKEIISGTSFSSAISINKNHDVFNGHFPGNPIVPGVCMLQIVKDLIEIHFQKQVRLQSISNVKFTAVINPAQHHNLDVLVSYENIENNSYKINSTISSKEVVFLKIINAVYFSP